jgi:hypothetical protein
MPSQDVTRYRWTRAYGLRFFASSIVLLAGWWLVTALTGFVDWAVVVLLVLVLICVACLLRLVIVPPILLELSVDGYRVRNVRGGGVSRSEWSHVESVAGGPGAHGAVVVVTLSNDRRSVVPVSLLGPQAITAEREIHTRLNAAFGYRRLPGH